jgi:hypothetical protein
MANDGIHASSPAARVATSRRFAALAIQAFRTPPEFSDTQAIPFCDGERGEDAEDRPAGACYARSASGRWNGFSTRISEYFWSALRSSE